MEKNGETGTRTLAAARLEQEHWGTLCSKEHYPLLCHSYFAFPAWATEDKSRALKFIRLRMDMCWVLWRSVFFTLFAYKAKKWKHALAVWEMIHQWGATSWNFDYFPVIVKRKNPSKLRKLYVDLNLEVLKMLESWVNTRTKWTVKHLFGLFTPNYRITRLYLSDNLLVLCQIWPCVLYWLLLWAE